MPFSIWLMPTEADAKPLSDIIDALSEAAKAKTFVPHLTLFTDYDDDFDYDTVISALSFLNATDSSTLTLGIDRFIATEKFFMALVFIFKQNGVLSDLQSSIVNHLRARDSYDFLPHMSLLFSDCSLEMKSQLRKTVQLPEKPIQFDRIVLMEEKDFKDPATWVERASWLLSEGEKGEQHYKR